MTAVSNEWREASDWDDPWEVGILYQDAHQQEGCGHAVQWIPDQLMDLTVCPICGAPVTMICDGSQKIFESQEANTQDCTHKYRPCVYIKFGKKNSQPS